MAKQTSGRRLGILVPDLHGGGAEFVARHWALWLARNGWQVDIVQTNPSNQPLPEMPGVTTIDMSSVGFLRQAVELRRIGRERQHEVLIALMPYFNVLALFVKFSSGGRFRVIISGRNMELALRPVNGLRFRVLQMLSTLTYRFADAYVAISHPVAAEAAALHKVPLARIFVVPNPATAKISLAPRMPLAGEPATNSSICLVVPARLVDQKRPEIAIRVAKILQAHFEHVSVRFYGSGARADAVLRLADDLEVEAKILGWVEYWFQDCPPHSVVLLPSVSEGFGNVLVEAAGVGIPSVATSRALGVADAIVPGVTGVLSAGDSPEEFADAVLRAEMLPEPHVDSWLQHFSVDNSGVRLERVITAVLGDN